MLETNRHFRKSLVHKHNKVTRTETRMATIMRVISILISIQFPSYVPFCYYLARYISKLLNITLLLKSPQILQKPKNISGSNFDSLSPLVKTLEPKRVLLFFECIFTVRLETILSKIPDSPRFSRGGSETARSRFRIFHATVKGLRK